MEEQWCQFGIEIPSGQTPTLDTLALARGATQPPPRAPGREGIFRLHRTTRQGPAREQLWSPGAGIPRHVRYHRYLAAAGKNRPMDRHTGYIVAAVVVVSLILGYALGWFGGAETLASTMSAPGTGTTTTPQ